ncbi:protein BIG GRAIN 1-like A [Solanum dulcamara]|uniref:protein BIG GRAIN 1-like A n=1 Tax=Solanum dulcamara TaxID=45834 RepID=UPI0024867CB8|nr:protein BIG GRAIN 1-like A [Solanum dulcamara]
MRTSIQEKFHNHQYPKDLNFYDSSLAKENLKHDEDGFKMTKSRALKIYRELKKVKGGRSLSSFLRSLFTNGKKAKISSNDDDDIKLKSTCLRKNIIISPYGHKNLDMDKQNVEAIKSINRNYIHDLKFHKNIEMFEEDEDEDEGASCASSDLFELDIFSPVYQTTNLTTN